MKTQVKYVVAMSKSDAVDIPCSEHKTLAAAKKGGCRRSGDATGKVGPGHHIYKIESMKPVVTKL